MATQKPQEPTTPKPTGPIELNERPERFVEVTNTHRPPPPPPDRDDQSKKDEK